MVIGTGMLGETVTITASAGTSITGNFTVDHAAGEPCKSTVDSGPVSYRHPANGSTGTVLKLYGDINDDGQMLYVDTCDVAANSLYRNVMAWNAGSKPALTPGMVLLNNVIANPGNAPCFTYQVEDVAGLKFVTGVAVTLSVHSQQKDAYSKQFQQATKTLLNVSPRNIFLVWTMESIGVHNRLQPMPPTVLLLLP